mgnify:CR=1 FL=1
MSLDLVAVDVDALHRFAFEAFLAMGASEGPLVGHILRKLRAAKLDHLVESEEDEKQLVGRILAGREDV